MYLYHLDYKIDPEDYGEIILHSNKKYTPKQFHTIINQEYRKLRKQVIQENKHYPYPICPDNRAIALLLDELQEKYDLKQIYPECETRVILNIEEGKIQQTTPQDNSGKIIRETKIGNN